MKHVNIEEKPTTILGRPFKLVNPDGTTEPMALKCEQCGHITELEKPVVIEQAGLPDLLKVLIFNIPRQQCSMQDSLMAGDFMQQMRESKDGVLELNDGTFDWLVKIVDKYGPLTYGVNAAPIKTALGKLQTREGKTKK